VNSLFWLLCAAMVALALVLVLPPLLRRPPAVAVTADGPPDARKRKALKQALDAGVLDADEYRRKLTALSESAVAAASPRTVGLPLALGVLLTFGAFALYHQLGDPRALDPLQRAPVANASARLSAPGTPQSAATTTPGGNGAAAPDMNDAIAGLAERMRTSPDDIDGWMLLGRAYRSTERFALAREAFANARRLAPEDADVMVEYAEASALASESKRLGGEPLLLIERALAIDPNHQRGLWLLGVSHMQAGVPADAVKVWERLLPLLEGAARESMATQIATARERAGLAPDPGLRTSASAPASNASPPAAAATPSTPVAADAAGSGARLVVDVDIDPALKAQIRASDVLFVFARAAEGPRMPLAIQRLSAGQLPVRVVLDDSTSMMPELKLSLMPQVVVGARISKSGQATPQTGDFEAVSAPLANSHPTPISLRIDRVLP